MGKNDLIIANNERTLEQLRRLQVLPLEQKINLTERRISQFSNELRGKVYISFSGGKDSTVLLNIARKIYPEIPGVFSDTGLEYPEIREFVKTIDNIEWIKPTLTFKQVLDNYGYPLPSKEVAEKVHQLRTAKSQKTINTRLYGDSKGNGKLSDKWMFLKDAPFKVSHNCCYHLKKKPFKQYEKRTGNLPIVGTMAWESSLRLTNWRKNGCNAFNGKRPMSAPMSFWTDEDVWEYIKLKNLDYSKIYDMGYKRTGCMFCMFGVFTKGDDRFKLMKETHPAQYNYCMKNLEIEDVLYYCNAHLSEKNKREIL